MDKNELTRLIEKYGKTVFRCAFCYTKNKEDAEDIMQDVFFKLFCCDKKFGGDEHIKAFLLRCTINRAKNFLRSSHKKLSDELDAAENIPAKAPREDSVLPLVLSLGEKNRAALYMYYYEGYSVKETARLLGITQTAVKMRLERGREQLKKLLSEEENYEYE